MPELVSLIATLIGSLLVVLPKLLARKRTEQLNSLSGDDAVVKALRELHVDATDLNRDQRFSLAKREIASRARRKSMIVVALYLTFLLAFVSIAGWRYRSQIAQMGDSLFLGVGLLFTMVAGMFVQVITTNYRDGRDLLDLEATRLVYPLLFSPIVFYPIWLVGDKQGAAAFSFYAAFLNGYFWQSIVSGVRLPAGGDMNGRDDG